MVRVLRVSVFIFPVICFGGTATSSSGSSRSGSMMTVATVAPETGVGLTLIKSSGWDLIGIPGSVVNWLWIFVFVVEPVRRLWICIRVFSHLCVNGSIFLRLKTKVVSAILRVLVLVVGFLLFIAPSLAGVVLQGSQNWDTLVRIFLDSECLSCRHWWHKVRQPVSHRGDGLLSLTVVARSHSCDTCKLNNGSEHLL